MSITFGTVGKGTVLLKKLLCTHACMEGIESFTRPLRNNQDIRACTLCRLLGRKKKPAPFPGRMSYKVTKPGLVFVLGLSMFLTVLLFTRAPFIYL